MKNDLLKPGYLPAEMGYCILPDGSGFVAMLTKMPGVTTEMINWWFTWHGLEGLRYKIWDPDEHYDVHVVKEDLEHRLDPRLNTQERNWGTTDIDIEDVGIGASELYISFISPDDYGYEMEQFRAPNVLTAVNANAGVNEQKIPMVTFTHFAREILGGIELRSRFWPGWNVIDQNPVRVADQIPFALVKGIAYHCAKEYTNLAAILSKVYEENVNIPDRLEDYQ